MNKKIIILIVVVILLGIGMSFYFVNKNENIIQQNTNQENLTQEIMQIAQVTFLCKNNKTIDATFYQGKEVPVEPGQMPIPSGSVKIILSDGRNFDLSQTISASGARYANNDESFVFWNKGNGAFILENNAETDYTDCVALAKDPGGLPNTYLDSDNGFTIRYPADYLLNTSYRYQGFGPGKEIDGIKITIPESLAAGTNLSSYDSGVSVEVIPDAQDCNANLFLNGNVETQTITDDREYSFASTTEGAAGNFYEEMVWAFPATNSCIGVRYLIHSTNIANYPEGTVSEFNYNSLIEQFDKIRHSLIVL